MNQYICYGDHYGCVCSDGTEFLFDADVLDAVKQYNWYRHRDQIEGNIGRKGKRVTIGRVVAGNSPFSVLRINKSVFDYRMSNLFCKNDVRFAEDCVEIITITGDTILVDADDYEKVKGYRWYLNTQKYAEAKMNGERVLLHRLIMNAPEDFTYGEVVDHINHNTLDNRKCNLRIVPQGVNTANRRLSSANTSGYNHVSVCKDGLFRASITTSGKKIDFGLYNTPEEAQNAIEYYLTSGCDPRDVPGRRMPPISASGHRYIYKHGENEWTVSVCKNHVSSYLGCFHSLDEAIIARDRFLNH